MISNVKEFTTELDHVLTSQYTENHRKILIPCVVAGDVNVDLSKIDINFETANYADLVLMNNFTQTILMPTLINFQNIYTN